MQSRSARIMLRKQFSDLAKYNQIDELRSILLVDDNIYHWECQLYGPKGSPYENGIFKIDINIPKRYPLDAPFLTMKTPIYHININAKGEIRFGALIQDWDEHQVKPTIKQMLDELIKLLKEPCQASGIMDDSLALYIENEKEYLSNAKLWTKEHALSKNTSILIDRISILEEQNKDLQNELQKSKENEKELLKEIESMRNELTKKRMDEEKEKEKEQKNNENIFIQGGFMVGCSLNENRIINTFVCDTNNDIYTDTNNEYQDFDGDDDDDDENNNKLLENIRSQWIDITFDDPLLGYKNFSLINDNTSHWQCDLIGPPRSLYESDIFKIDIQFPKKYPLIAPCIKMLKPNGIYHMNINTNGEIGFGNIIDNWAQYGNEKPKIRDILDRLMELLERPCPNTAMRNDLRNLFNTNRRQYYFNCNNMYTHL